jgi:hypothetical protein
LSELATVDIGVVTGANAYFVLSPSEAEAKGLPREYLTGIVERPRDVPGLLVGPAETSLLLLVPQGDPPIHPAVAKYLRDGRENGVPNGYKCRVRKFWYSVPLPRKRPQAFLPYMTGDAPRLSGPVAVILARLHPELDALVREGRADRATRVVDAVLGIDPGPFDEARLVFRSRRRERAKASKG